MTPTVDPGSTHRGGNGSRGGSGKSREQTEEEFRRFTQAAGETLARWRDFAVMKTTQLWRAAPPIARIAVGGSLVIVIGTQIIHNAFTLILLAIAWRFSRRLRRVLAAWLWGQGYSAAAHVVSPVPNVPLYTPGMTEPERRKAIVDFMNNVGPKAGASYHGALEERQRLREIHTVLARMVQQRLDDRVSAWASKHPELSSGQTFDDYFGSGAVVEWRKAETRFLSQSGVPDEPLMEPFEQDPAIASSVYICVPVLDPRSRMHAGHLMLFASNAQERVADHDRLRHIYEGTMPIEQQVARIAAYAPTLDSAFFKSPIRERVCAYGFDFLKAKFPPPGARLDGGVDLPVLEAEYTELPPKGPNHKH